MLKGLSTAHFNSLKSPIKLCSILCLSLWLTACQTQTLHVYSVLKEGVDLSQYQTFTIPALGNVNSKYYDYINKGIINNLTTKGYQQSEQADLITRYSLKFQTDEQVKMEAISEKGNIHTDTFMEAIFEAVMLVNIIDTKTNIVIWKAATTRDLKSVNLKEVDQESINRSIEELFESFPAR
jgi:hypothetical protein